MIVKHADGRVVVLAKERGLAAMERMPSAGSSQWRRCYLTGEDLQEFVQVDAAEAQALLTEALTAAPSVGAQLAPKPAPSRGGAHPYPSARQTLAPTKS